MYQQSVQVSSWPLLLHCLGHTAVTLPPVVYTQPTQLLEVFCLRVGKPTEPGNIAQLEHGYHHHHQLSIAEHPLVAVVLQGGAPRPGPDEPLRQPLVVPLGVPRSPRRLVCQHLGPGTLPPPPQP